MGLRFEVEARGARQFIRVSSSQPINEPFVDMLLELTWTNGRLVREYTFLLDPADMRSANAPQVAAPVENRAAQGAAPRAAAPAPAAPAPAARAAAAPVESAARPSRPASPSGNAGTTTEYEVKRGDTLGKIAGRMKPGDISLDMMLVALYRANPEAFSGNNMNRLKSGTILSVPDADAVRSSAGSQGDAHGVVVAHAADFNAYRAKLAGQVASSTAAKAPEQQQSAAGKITARVEEHPTAVTESKDQLKLSKAGEAAGKAGQTAAVEDKIAKQRAADDAAARVKELEKNVGDLEKLMAVKNKAAAEAQNKASVPELDVTGKTVTPPAGATAANAPAVAKPETPAPAKPKKPVVTPPPAPVQEPGIVDFIMDNLQIVGVAVAALLGGAALVLARRRKQQELAIPKTESSLLGDPGTTAAPMFAETGGQSVDTSNSVFNSNFAPSASQLDTNEVDPVAEADVYIAYGRDAQAEEILKEALRNNPERHVVRLKLMEIYASRKDTRAFETQASEMYAMTKGQGDEWAQATALGQSIDADNPLYASAAQPAASGFGMAAAGAAVGAGAVAGTSEDVNDFASLFADATQRNPATAEEPSLDLDLSQEAVAPTAAADSNVMDFDLDRDATALPSLGDMAREEEAKQAAKADTNTLDFDLGGLSFEPSTPAAEAAPAAEPVQASNDVPDLAFDLDFDAAPAKAAAADTDLTAVPELAPLPEAEPVAAAAAPSLADDLGMDFNLDLPGEVKPAAEAEAKAVDADPLAGLDLMDFTLPGSPAPAVPADETPLSASDFAPADFDLPDTEPALAPAAPALAEAAPEFDLSGIDLDLGTELVKPQAEVEMSALHMEMDTKLDLAIAYQEIGDKEGARELLDEVIRGGSDEQIARASTMRAQLG
ncbi:FimV/HubP family polar landmark protein [Pseudoduganella sp. UC29_106]|uniref:FimV/HubP family polar landmark protein n=1 Tax=Pseudoduganella sp. UC29_106 TaxID=3374553 RepID=UPI003756E546